MNILDKITDKIKKFANENMESRKRRDEEEIRKAFRLAEKDGSIYITHNGRAICKFENEARQDGILGCLKVFRDTAVEYER